MQNIGRALKQSSRINIARASEHNPHRARLLRTEIRKTGKRWNEFTANELIEINRKVDCSDE